MQIYSSERGAGLLDYVAVVALVAIIASAGVAASGRQTTCSLSGGAMGIDTSRGFKPKWEEKDKGNFYPESMVQLCDIPCKKKKGPINGWTFCYVKEKKVK